MTTEKPQSINRREFLKGAAAVGGAAVASVVLAACGANPPAATQVPAAVATGGAPPVNTGAKQTVRYLSWWFQEGNRGKTWLSLVKEFNDSQKDIEVTTENIPFDDYTTKIIVQSQAGKFDGDILMATPELAPRMVRSGLLAPLDDVLTRKPGYGDGGVWPAVQQQTLPGGRYHHACQDARGVARRQQEADQP
ncbi:MAG: extracellular solute-binding protein [Chloroflexi bacterium]|nr:MAG: extracellular solute-binding protein [Chloroflexota bacterium]